MLEIIIKIYGSFVVGVQGPYHGFIAHIFPLILTCDIDSYSFRAELWRIS